MIKNFLMTILAVYSSFVFANNNTVNFLVGFPPGGGNYLITKLVADTAAKKGITNTLEIKPGAGGIIGINECVKKKEPNTLCTISQAQYVFGLASDARKFDPETLTYVKAVSSSPTVLVTSPSNTSTLKSLLVDMKNNTKSVTFAIGAFGLKATTSWFVTEVGSANSILVDYKGTGPAITDVIGKHVDYAFVPYAAVYNQINQGILKVIGISGEKNSERLKEFQAIQELVPTMHNDNAIFGFVMAPDIDKNIVEKYNKILTEIMQDEQFKSLLEKNGMFLVDPKLGPKDFERIAKEERRRLSTLIKNLSETK